MFTNNLKSKIISAILLGLALGTAATYAKAEEVTLKPNESWSGTLPISKTLSLEGRIDYSKPAGANYILQVSVNGQVVASPLTNKGQSFRYADGRTYSYLSSAGSWILFYSPDFSSNNSTAGGGYQVLTDPGQAYRYTWDVSALTKNATQMTVTIKNTSPTYSIVGRLTASEASTFPIKELGNCSSQNECKKYCEDPANMTACTDYGLKMGMISPEDAARAKEFSDVLKGDGPGACKNKDECEKYCADLSHAVECVAFAEKHNLIPSDQLGDAKKVVQALQSGAQLPGGCKDKDSCENYCKAGAHATECIAFAEKAGFLSGEELAQAKKVLPFLEKGETPGKCTNKDECENYCKDNAHLTECVNFAEKAGFMTSEEATLVRKIGGKGPGGCDSKAACDAYCNKPENQNACFAFAEEHDLIPADKLQQIKDGMGRLRSGIGQMPKEAIDCLKSQLGDDIVSKIENGTFTPGPQTGDTIKNCMAAAMPQIKEKVSSALKMATPEVTKCLEQGLGQDGLQKLESGGDMTPEMGDTMKKCFESMKQDGLNRLREALKSMPASAKQCFADKLGADTIAKVEQGDSSVELGPDTQGIIQSCVESMKSGMMQQMQTGLEQAPPEIRDCIKSKLGDIESKVQSGAVKGQADIQTFIQECMKNFKPQGIPSPEDMKNYKPQGVPSSEDMKNYKAPDAGSFGPPAGIPSAPGGAPSDMCANFASVPSCDYVPASVKDLCEKCKK